MRRSIPSRRLPVVFVGHGAPVNAIEKNPFTDSWSCIGASIGKPRAVLVISAHWLTEGIQVTAMENPKMVHDIYPQAPQLMDFRYDAPGSSILAARISDLLKPSAVTYSVDWGLDQGAWSVLSHFYPNADVPVVQLSIDISKPLRWHYKTAKKLQALRNEGVLIIGSGNVVYNPVVADHQRQDFAYDWADSFQQKVMDLIISGKEEQLLDLSLFGREGSLSVPMPDHYLPLIYALAMRDKQDDAVEFITPTCINGSISMMSMALWPSANPN